MTNTLVAIIKTAEDMGLLHQTAEDEALNGRSIRLGGAI
ncbi:hypothetical protein roselon_01599 [Roseibacterium elongatum DSM 19469]|uniref:Uncharacterized protein n=1 Tax=Roseicyclus elongatus DSM 19469 TaxID=1294273 RepID=W8S5A5_9RHOB|nr:hypothetical protein roselon_01599 [Roseibacterium elongatum DSM 19469]